MLKVSVIGAGSTYTPELIKGFFDRIDQFPLSELWLMDIDAQRLNIVGSFAQRITASKSNSFKVVLTTDQRAAISGSQYVITQLRVGQMPARREDEYLGKRHGLIGQETTGIGGMAKALRTIPIILDVADDLQKLASDALLVNFTNPSGLITEALSRHAPRVKFVGVCNSAFTTKMAILSEISKLSGISISPARAVIKTLGLNHLTWVTDFWVDGVSLWESVMRNYLDHLKSAGDPEFDPELVKTLGMIPNSYLKYFYHTEKMLEKQSLWPPSRADAVMKIEEKLLGDYADPNLTEPPAELMLRGGAWYSTVAIQLLNAHYNNWGEEHVVNTRQAGAVQEYDTDWVMELPCTVDKNGIHPLPARPLPLSCFNLISAVKEYELLTVEAAVHGDRTAARKAMIAHPLGPKESAVDLVLKDLLETHRTFLPRFFK